jgi:uncharacterized protein
MTAGLEARFNILQQSPHDLSASACEGVHLSPDLPVVRWRASRYNIRAASEDGGFILWNTLSNAISVFRGAQVPLVEKALRGVEAREKGTIKYLVDRGFLIREWVNEYRQFQSRFGAQHYNAKALELILLPSEDCNFRCRYCYEDFVRGTMRPEVRAGIKKLVEGRVKYLDRLSVSWFGGEPLYGWEAIEELAPFFREVVERHELSFHGHMTTNGYLLTPDVAEKLLSWRVTSYQITLDGAQEDHDRSRPARDGSGTFGRIYENLLSIAKRPDKFDITVRINLSPDNAPRIHELLDCLEADLGDDPRFNLSFQPVSKWGGGNDGNFEVCGAEDGGRLMSALLAAAKKRGLKLPGITHINRFGSNICYAARPYNYLIGAAGQVMKCTILLDKDPANVVGRITSEGELVLDHDRFAAWTEPVFERDTQCQKCLFLPSCAGAYCPLPRIQEGGRKCVPERRDPKGTVRQLAKESVSARTVFVGSDADEPRPEASNRP